MSKFDFFLNLFDLGHKIYSLIPKVLLNWLILV